ncbi:hypothetical protein SDC9_158136 [bioreactor metagenome]|uniref:Uncharacterized protein n=1 Tax=bioreactor metagenome TaxID=1076179 RepID=A0A645FBX3_9ZZZZ
MHALIDQRQFDIRQSAHAGEQVKVLEDEADLTVADARELLFGILLNRLPVQDIFAAVGHIQTTDDVHQRGLAAAAWPDNAHKFAFIDGQIGAVQRAHLFSADRIHLCNAGHGDDRPMFGRHAYSPPFAGVGSPSVRLPAYRMPGMPL